MAAAGCAVPGRPHSGHSHTVASKLTMPSPAMSQNGARHPAAAMRNPAAGTPMNHESDQGNSMMLSTRPRRSYGTASPRYACAAGS